MNRRNKPAIVFNARDSFKGSFYVWAVRGSVPYKVVGEYQTIEEAQARAAHLNKFPGDVRI